MLCALLAVDVQNDFCPGGSVGAPRGDLVVPVLNRYLGWCHARNLPIFASRDWHTENSRHFLPNGGTWPPHCIQGSRGAEFHPELLLPPETIILSKGMNPGEDGRSAFQGVDSRSIPLMSLLAGHGVHHLFIGGLTTEYCVKHSVLDALRADLRVHILVDAIRGIDAQPDDSHRAIGEMVDNGALPAILEELEAEFYTACPAHR